MGEKSNVSKETSTYRADTNLSDITPSPDDTTEDVTPLPEDAPAVSEQQAIVPEITPSSEDTIDDTIIVPEVIPTTSQQKALVVVPPRLPSIVISPPRKSRVGSTVSVSSKNNRHRGGLFIILTAIALFFVAIGGSYVVLGANTGISLAPLTNLQPSKATALVTITPLHPILKHTYTITSVTGQPNMAQNQVGGARTISDSQSQSLQVNATGNVTIPATNASGTLIFSRVRKKVTIPAGTPFLDKNNIALVLNAPVTLLRVSGFTISVGAHANPAGSKGNVPALDINGAFCYPNCATGSAFHLQNTAFAGGQDALSYRVVQQSDINNAASQLVNSLASTAQAAVQAQIKASEQSVGSISCGLSSLSSNQQAGARVSSVIVSVTETCRNEVYNVQPAQALAANLLKRDVTTIAGAGYVIVGNVTTIVQAQPKLIDTQGTVSMNIMASATAFYQFTATEAQAFARLIAGKSLADAQALLLQQIGVARATITISDHSANKLPDDPSRISVVASK